MKNQLHVRWRKETSPVILNLDVMFRPLFNHPYPILNYKYFEFKGGEPHIQLDLPEYADRLIITQRFNSVADIFKIVMANDAAKRAGFKDVDLVLPYFPAARQDRVCNDGEPLTIKLFTDMINACGFGSVHILSPHSEVTPALLDNVVVHDEIEYVYNAIESILLRASIAKKAPVKEINIVCPDAGAGKRVGKVTTAMNKMFADITFNLIRCEKERDVTDGTLKGFYVQADDLGGHPTIIVDDINSMSGTFIGLGKELRNKNCGNLMLFTSHCDCVEGIIKAREFFDHVYTTNSKKNWKDECVEYDDTTIIRLGDNFTCFDISI